MKIINFQSAVDEIALFLQSNQYVSIVLLTGLVAILLWKPKAVFKLLILIGIFSLIFYGVFYFGETFTGGMKMKKDVVRQTEEQLQKDRLAIPSRE